jgi:hypothetical protein
MYVTVRTNRRATSVSSIESHWPGYPCERHDVAARQVLPSAFRNIGPRNGLRTHIIQGRRELRFTTKNRHFALY